MRVLQVLCVVGTGVMSGHGGQGAVYPAWHGCVWNDIRTLGTVAPMVEGLLLAQAGEWAIISPGRGMGYY